MEAKNHYWPGLEPAPVSLAEKSTARGATIRSLLRSARLSWVTAHRRQIVLATFLLALALRVGFALTLPTKLIWEDGARYQKVAIKLLATHEFGSLEENRLSVPLPPLVIAATYTMFGRNLLALRLVWALLGAITCVLVYLLGRALANPTVGVLAGLTLAVYPYYIYLNTMFEYPQTVFIFLMALGFLGLTAFDASRRWVTLLAASFCLGAAILSVPTAAIFLPFVVLWLMSRLYPKRALATGIALLLLGALGPVTSWAVRNYRAYGRLVIINCAGGVSFWKGNNATYAAYGKAGTELAEGETPDPKYLFLAELDQVKRSLAHLGPIDSWIELERIGWLRGVSFIRQDPGRFVKLTFRKFLHFWSPYPDAVSKNGQMSPTRTAIALVTYGPILLLGALGLLLGLRDWRRFSLVYAYIGSLTIAYSLFLPTTRYRLPIDFFLVIFAAMFVERCIRRWRSHTLASARSVALEWNHS